MTRISLPTLGTPSQLNFRLHRAFCTEKDAGSDEGSKRKEKKGGKKGGNKDKESSGGILGLGGSKKEISLSEAKMIFGIEEEAQYNKEHILTKWTLLRKNNEPEKGGSMYLLHKIQNARNKLAKELGISAGEFSEPEPVEKEKPAAEKDKAESSPKQAKEEEKKSEDKK